MKNALITILGIVVIGLGGYVGYQHLNPSKDLDKDIQVAPTQSSSDLSDGSENTKTQDNEQQNTTNEADDGTTESYNEAMKTGKKYVGPQNAPEGSVNYIGQQKQSELLDKGEVEALPAGGLHFEENEKGAGLFDDKGMMWTLDEKGIAWPMN